MRRLAMVASAWVLGLGLAPGTNASPTTNDATDDHSAPLTSSASTSASGGDLKTILGVDDPTDRASKLQAYAQSVPVEKIAEAAQQLSSNTPMDQASPALTTMLQRWVKADPSGARAAIGAAQNQRLQYALTQSVFESLASTDSTGALQAAQQLPSLQLRDLASAIVVREVARQDPAAAFKLCSEAKMCGPALGAIYTAWADRDLNQATQSLLNLPHADDRINVVRTVAFHLAQKDPAAAISWLDGLPPADSDTMSRRMLVAHWGQADPRAAADYVHGVQDIQPDLVPGLAYALVATWSQTDPKSAAQWIAGMPAKAQTDALPIAISNWARTDPNGAAAFLRSVHLDDIAAGRGAAAIAAQLAKTDEQAAMNWANQLPEGPQRYSAIDAVTQQSAKQTPAKAAALIATMPDGPMKYNAIGQLIVAWVKDDPTAAAQWAVTLPVSKQSDFFVFSTLGANWGNEDPEKASAWIAQLPKGDRRDIAVQAFSNVMVRTDPNSALQWASSISNDEARQNQITNIYRKWLQSDPDQAQAALQKSSLTSDQKSEILDNPE